jgi:hypothetical protein
MPRLLRARAPDTADLVRTAVRMATLRVKQVEATADDIASTARRPDAVLCRGGLAGPAALGILEWPAATAAGVAAGRRRSCPHWATT